MYCITCGREMARGIVDKSGLDYCSVHCRDIGYLQKDNAQLQARVDELEQRQKWIDEAKRPDHPDDERPWCCEYLNAKERIATLEQKLQKKQDVIKAMDACIVEYEQQLDKIKERFHCMNETHEHTGAEEILCSIDFQIQQAEKRGYELCKNYIIAVDGGFIYSLSEYLRDYDVKLRTYEQSVAERDGGAK